MGLVVERSARSPLLVEGRDFSLGIYAADGVLLEQTEYIPVLGYATAPGMRAIAEAFTGDRAGGRRRPAQRPVHGRQPALRLEGREAGLPRGRALRLGRDRRAPGRRRRRRPRLLQPERDRPLAGGPADHAPEALRGRQAARRRVGLRLRQRAARRRRRGRERDDRLLHRRRARAEGAARALRHRDGARGGREPARRGRAGGAGGDRADARRRLPRRVVRPRRRHRPRPRGDDPGRDRRSTARGSASTSARPTRRSPAT